MTATDKNSQGKVVVITGASSGIGREVARQMAQKGHTVYDLSRSDKPQQGVQHITCDVTSRECANDAISKVIAQSGRIDILILCAGSGVAGALEMMTEEEMKFQFDVNVYGPLRVCQAAMPFLRTQEADGHGERGRILFISSMGAAFPLPFQGLYSATKAAINAMAYAMRNETNGMGIQIASILPGDVKTGFTAARKKNLKGGDIYKHMDGAFDAMAGDEEHGKPADFIGGQIVKIALKKKLKMYYTLDALSHMQYFLHRFAPDSLVLWALRKMYRC